MFTTKKCLGSSHQKVEFYVVFHVFESPQSLLSIFHRAASVDSPKHLWMIHQSSRQSWIGDWTWDLWKGEWMNLFEEQGWIDSEHSKAIEGSGYLGQRPDLRRFVLLWKDVFSLWGNYSWMNVLLNLSHGWRSFVVETFITFYDVWFFFFGCFRNVGWFENQLSLYDYIDTSNKHYLRSAFGVDIHSVVCQIILGSKVTVT